MMASEWRHSLSRERKSCRSLILKILKRKNVNLKELLVLYQEKRIFLFGGHLKELHKMILEENDKDVLVGNIRSWPSLHRRIIRRTLDRENCTLKELGKRDLNKDVRMELEKMIQNEDEQNIKQEKKTAFTPRKPLIIACKLTDDITHLIHVDLKTNKELLSLSNRTLCGQIVTHDNVVDFSNKANCKTCLRKEAK